MWIRKRGAYLWAILRRPVTVLYASPFGLWAALGVWDWAQGQLIPQNKQQSWQLGHLFSSIPWYWVALATCGLVIVGIFESAFRHNVVHSPLEPDVEFERQSGELAELIEEGLRLAESKDLTGYRGDTNAKHRQETDAWRDRCCEFLSAHRGKADAAGFRANRLSPSGKGDVYDRCCEIQSQIAHLRDVNKTLLQQRDERANQSH